MIYQSYLYEHIENYILKLAEKKIVTPGEKLPSLRTISKTFQVSMTTAMKAYEELESKGLIYSVEKSGYYLKPQNSVKIPERKNSIINKSPVENIDIINSILNETHSKNILPLGAAVASPKLMPHKELKSFTREVINGSEDQYINYAPTAGSYDLRVEIARLMALKDFYVSPEEIIITNGAMEGIFYILSSVAEQGDAIAIESPTYFGYLHVLKKLGMYPVEIPACPEKGIDIAYLQKAKDKYDIKCVITQPAFSNPTGSLMCEDKKHYLRSLASEKFIIIEDDTFGTLSHTYDKITPLANPSKNDHIIYVSSFSKTVSPGSRIGWIIPNKYYKDVYEAKLANNMSSASLPQLVMSKYLQSGKFHNHIKKLSKTLFLQINAYREELSRLFGSKIRMTNPKGGFLLWLQLPEKTDTLALYHKALDHGIGFSPGAIFSSKPDKFRNYLRINCGYPLNAGIEKGLGKIYELYNGMF